MTFDLEFEAFRGQTQCGAQVSNILQAHSPATTFHCSVKSNGLHTISEINSEAPQFSKAKGSMALDFQATGLSAKEPLDPGHYIKV